MDIPQVYAMGVGGAFLILIFLNLIPYVRNNTIILANKHLAYPLFVRRHHFLGPWSRADVILQSLYVGVNIVCVGFKPASVHMAGLRAGTLSLVNMIPLFAGFHLSFLADILGIRLKSYQLIHRSVAAMSVLLLIFHIMAAFASRSDFSLHITENLWGVIVILPLSFKPALLTMKTRAHHLLV